MRILLQWLVEYAWAPCGLCAAAAVFYIVRAVMAQRKRDMAQFTLERETENSRVVQNWAMAVFVVVLGAAIYVGAAIVPPDMLPDSSGTPTPSSGVAPQTPNPTAALTPTPGYVVPTFTPTAEGAVVPTPPPPSIEPTAEETPAAAAGISSPVNVTFGSFAELVAFTVPAAEVTTAEPLQLTLQWRALETTSAIDYQVFTHLVSEDGRLIAQHDGFPVEGGRPISSWTMGETLVDIHPMSFYDLAFTGAARIEVGLWDPGSGRVPTGDGSDHVTLITINVISQQ